MDLAATITRRPHAQGDRSVVVHISLTEPEAIAIIGAVGLVLSATIGATGAVMAAWLQSPRRRRRPRRRGS